MKHISIIHSTQPDKPAIPCETFEDIKLTGILPDNVLSVMGYLPCEADMIARQEIFKYLLENGSRELEALCQELRELKDIFDAYNACESDDIKYYIFAALLRRVCRFYKSSSEIEHKVSFLYGYAEHFASMCDETVYSDAEKVYERLIRSINIELKEDHLAIKADACDGYVTAIRRCADDMGIELSRVDFSPKSLSAELVCSLSSLYPVLWSELKALYDKYKDHPDEAILQYIDQFDFYIANTALAREYGSHSIPVSYAHMTHSDELCITEGYDITLMAKECYDIVPNDISFNSREPLFFLAGANGGGKTTYLRTSGVTVIMSLCGCPVPCRSAKICRLDSVLTHFPRDERFELEGRFLDEQKRVDDLISKMGKRSLVLLNETYATTNEQKATEMTCTLAKRLYDAGQFGIYVTHQKKVYDLDIPMLCCVVDSEDENRRTYKIRRVKETMTSHAEDVLKKYQLSRADLEERFGI